MKVRLNGFLCSTSLCFLSLSESSAISDEHWALTHGSEELLFTRRALHAMLSAMGLTSPARRSTLAYAPGYDCCHAPLAEFRIKIEAVLTAGPINLDEYSGSAEQADKDTVMRQGWMKALLCGLGLSAVALTGCQVHLGGQTLPSSYYLEDDVQYFGAGPEFPLSREAAAMKAYQAEADAQ